MMSITADQRPAQMEACLAEADRALAHGDLAGARDLLESIVSAGHGDLDVWRRLAALRRASGELSLALEALRQALIFAPLDFTTLLARADVLEAMGDERCGEAYGQAIAQRPDGELPPPLVQALEHGTAVYSAYQSRLEEELRASLAGLSSEAEPLGEVARGRIERLISNISRRTRVWHSEPTHFHYPGLHEAEFHARERCPWLSEWEDASELIAREFESLVADRSAELVPYISYAEHLPVAQWKALNGSRQWTAIHLIERGQVHAQHAAKCPGTMALLDRFPQPRIPGIGANAMFSLLAPRTRIPPHVGFANFRLVAHLPLQVPAGCGFRVGATRREWRLGEAFVFDDTIEHEAWNDSDQLRVVMIVDCWHPDLSEIERSAITAVAAAQCANVPADLF